jgi:hypothetical protein
VTDNEVTAALLRAAWSRERRGMKPPAASSSRDHYRLLYERNPDDIAINTEAAQAIASNAATTFGSTNVYYDAYRERWRGSNFPVLAHDGRIVSSLALSEVIRQVPVVAVDYVFVAAPFGRLRKHGSGNTRPVITPYNGDR